MGSGRLAFPDGDVAGEFVSIDGERFYRISNFDQMPDFFMSIVSDSDHWMFLSSNGALTAGRRDRNHALFPYYTVDKIHDFHDRTGSATAIHCRREGRSFLWQPFSRALTGLYATQRNIYKSICGNKVIFEEINRDLGLGFRYGWYNSDRFGAVKRASLRVLGDEPVSLRLLDGLRNILPSDVDSDFQSAYSNLLDGYKKQELLEHGNLALFTLSAIPVDRAEPSECLRATTVWSAGLDAGAILLSERQYEAFRRGRDVTSERDVKGVRGAYFLLAELDLAPGEASRWMIVAEVDQTSASVNNLHRWLANTAQPEAAVIEDIAAGTERLAALVASADGVQATDRELTAARHFSNTLFNIMRGGIYLDGYRIAAADFRAFVGVTSSSACRRHATQLQQLPATLDHRQLQAFCDATGDPDLVRIGLEYLPLTFSRRHGDPSRPWNQFAIVTRNADGTPVSDYQGNWRDIFQNWEALCLSYPEFIGNIIGKFLNASTADGYNPYRITRGGIDWERPDPGDPWAYIGYWGDHQIIYLQKLLELSERFYPAALGALLTRDIFAYANVPYRIRPYADIVADPKNTIDFDDTLEQRIDRRVAELGADGRLLQHPRGGVLHVNMAEKILVTTLAKLSNFVPGAGIWMNTQRPEWNDANNALVGHGVSVVTLCYLRRFLDFWARKWRDLGDVTLAVSAEVSDFFDAVAAVLRRHEAELAGALSDTQRRTITDQLGIAGSDYRHRIYRNALSGERRRIPASTLAACYELALRYADHSIAANRRDDGLYHAYNLIAFRGDGVAVRTLYEMLEGQVAVLSTGHLSAAQSLEILDAMKASRLFREDQYSYMLYPDRELPRFTEKNRIPAAAVESSALLRQLLEDDRQPVVERDDSGVCHFSSDFHHAGHLASALDALPGDSYGDLVAAQRDRVLDIYEEMFDHQSFTGRSGTFYAYEGLGCIYWHMVSKLLLAVSETFLRAVDRGESPALLGRLKDHYHEIKAGIGLNKSPSLYGAFPIDAYSHSGRESGVQQPGMTGQVKEDILSRVAELGVRVEDGRISFDPRLLDRGELLAEATRLRFLNREGDWETLDLAAGELAFGFCQVPVIYRAAAQRGITLRLAGGETRDVAGGCLDARTSAEVFARSGAIRRIEVAIVCEDATR